MATTFRVAGRVMKCPVGKLKFETVSTVSTAVALAVTTLVAGSGDALVGGFAGVGLGLVLAPSLRTGGAALVVAVE